MRILITSDIFPPEAGGPATYVPLVARELAVRGHSVRVLTYSNVHMDAADAAYPFEVERIVIRGPRLMRLWRVASRIAANMRLADVLYSNGLLTESAPVNLFLGRPVVAKVVGDIAWERARDKGWIADGFEAFQSKRYHWRIELRRILRTWALRRAKAIIVPSAYLGRIVTAWGLKADRVHVVYNAFESKASDVPTVELPLRTRYRLITVCRLTAWKGVDGLIDAVATLPEMGLAIVGDGPERAKLEALAEQLGVLHRVYFAGQVSMAEVAAYLEACDLFVLNSRYEGLPHVLLEAMAAGLPVVATDVGGIGEVVQQGRNGWLIQAGDSAQLRRAILRALKDADLRARCSEERALAVQRFTPSAMADATEQILMRAAA